MLDNFSTSLPISLFGSLTSVVAALKAGFSALVRRITSYCLKAEDFDDLLEAGLLVLQIFLARLPSHLSGQLSGKASA